MFRYHIIKLKSKKLKLDENLRFEQNSKSFVARNRRFRFHCILNGVRKLKIEGFKSLTS